MQSDLTTSKISRAALAKLSAYNEAKNVGRRQRNESPLTKYEELEQLISAACGEYTEYTVYTRYTEQKSLFPLDETEAGTSNSNMDKPIAQGGK